MVIPLPPTIAELCNQCQSHLVQSSDIHPMKVFFPKDQQPAQTIVMMNTSRPWDLRSSGFYAALSGSSVPTFQDNLLVASSRVKKSKNKALFLTSWPLKMWFIGCPETSAQNYHSRLRNIPEARRFHLHRGGRPSSGTRLIHYQKFTVSYNLHGTVLVFQLRVCYSPMLNSARDTALHLKQVYVC